MSVFEKRATIIQTQNTAQIEFENILASFPTNTNEVAIHRTLHGDIYLDPMNFRGYIYTRNLIFSNPNPTQRGEITNVKNIPAFIRKLVITNQLLTEIQFSSPNALEEINLEKNYIKQIDASLLVKCKKMTLNMNELTELKNLPASLEELYVNDNKLKTFDFKNTPKLRVFHCKNNPQLTLINVPRTSIDIQMDGDYGTSVAPVSPMQYVDEPSADNDVSDADSYALPSAAYGSPSLSPASAPASREQTVIRNMDYVECLHEYFKLKAKYETAELEARRKAYAKHRSHKLGKQAARSVIPKCVKCARHVGSVFTMKDNRYIAVCGDKAKPCSLRLELFRGEHENLHWLLANYRETLETQKEGIIRQKMDTLFNFVGEENAVRAFKEKLEEYNVTSSLYKEFTDKYANLFQNEHKRALIKTKMEQVYRLKDTMANMANEFETTGNRQALQTLVNIYQKEYTPEILNLRRLHYESMAMDEIKEDEHVLYQHEVALSKLDYLWGEPPRVIAFSNV